MQWNGQKKQKQNDRFQFAKAKKQEVCLKEIIILIKKNKSIDCFFFLFSLVETGEAP